MGGSQGAGGGGPPLLLRCTAILIHHLGGGGVGLAASCRSRPSGVGVLPCPTTLSPPGSIGPGPRNLHVTGTHCLPVPRLQTHGDGCAPGTTGGDPRSLTARWHRWRRRTSRVPHSHGLGRCWQVEGSQGAQSPSLPWDLPGKVPGCGAAAPLVPGARRAHHRTGPSCGGGGADPGDTGGGVRMDGSCNAGEGRGHPGTQA